MTMNRTWRNQGASAVEFAIILPFLMIILFGIIEFSLALYDKAIVTNASREAARAAVVYRWGAAPTLGELQAQSEAIVSNYVNNRLVTFGTSNPVTVNVTELGTTPNRSISVTVSYRYDYLVLPAFISALTGGINLDATTEMRREE